MKEAKILLKSILVILAIVIIIFSMYPYYSKWQDERIVKSLEEKVLPYLKANKITGFVDIDNCKAIEYGTVSATAPLGCTYINRATLFTEKDLSKFQNFKIALENGSLKRIVRVDTEFTPYNHPVDSVGPRNIGISFHIACTYCRTRYVYWPNYKSLPAQWVGEIEYTRVDDNWYRVNED